MYREAVRNLIAAGSIIVSCAAAAQEIGALDPETLEKDHAEAIAQCPGRAEWVAHREKLASERKAKLPESTAPPTLVALHDELLAMDKEDRRVRAILSQKKLENDVVDPKTQKQFHDAIWKNYFRMKDLVTQQGFPTAEMVGQDGVDAAFMLVQHANMDVLFQGRALDLIQKRVESGEISLPRLALLTDRVSLQQIQIQRFGTQFQRVGKKIIVLWDVESPARLDQRREKMGLEPMALYVCEIEKSYGLTVDTSVLENKKPKPAARQPY